MIIRQPVTNGCQGPSEEEITSLLFKPTMDMSLYSKLMAIDPNAARTFIQTRLDNLNAQLLPIKEEIKKLNEIISYDKNKEIRAFYKSTEPIKRPYGISATVNAFFVKNPGKEFRANDVLEHLKSISYKGCSVNEVTQALSRLVQKGLITKPYRGVYKKQVDNE